MNEILECRVGSLLEPLLQFGRSLNLLDCLHDAWVRIEEVGHVLEQNVDVIRNEKIDPSERGTDEVTVAVVVLEQEN